MPNVNKVILIGHLTRDPALKYLPSQTAIAEFGIAVSRKFKTASGEQKEEVAFIDCACFGKGGETLNQFCKKGSPLYVEGRLKYDTWEDKQGGGKRSKLSVVVDQFQFLSSRGDSDGSGNQSTQSRPQQNRPGQRTPQRPIASPPIEDEPVFTDEDIPF
jgi:single-strand DNA-binding protein